MIPLIFGQLSTFPVAKLDDCGIFPEFRSKKQLTHLKRMQIQELSHPIYADEHFNFLQGFTNDREHG